MKYASSSPYFKYKKMPCSSKTFSIDFWYSYLVKRTAILLSAALSASDLSAATFANLLP